MEFSDEGWGDETAQGPDSNIYLLLDSTKDPIDRLYKLSTRIRNPPSRFGSSKALRHQKIDEESKVDLLQAIEEFDHDYVSSLFLQYRKSNALENPQGVKPPEDKDGGDDNADNVWEPIRTVLLQYKPDLLKGTESFLVRRIARANVRRRQQFTYWKKHRDKLTHHTRIFTQHVEAPKEASPIAVHVETQPREVLIPIIAPQSITTATHLNFPQLAAKDDQSIISVSEYAPSTHYSKEIVNFPPAPKRQPNEKFFECPYCFTLCSTALLAQKAWE